MKTAWMILVVVAIGFASALAEKSWLSVVVAAIVGPTFVLEAIGLMWPSSRSTPLYRFVAQVLRPFVGILVLVGLLRWCVGLIAFALPGWSVIPASMRMAPDDVRNLCVVLAFAAAYGVALAVYKRLRPAHRRQHHPPLNFSA
jgi:hypothetical protein